MVNAMGNNIAIKVSNLSKKYALYEKPQHRFKEVFSLTKKSYHKDFFALSNIEFEVQKGETVGIVGTNGSGKSTLLKIITGVLQPTNGTVNVCGKISALLELGAGFNQEYTGRQNIFLNGRMMGFSKKEMEDKEQTIIDFADIGDFVDQPVKTYSSGMFARLAFAVAINVEPDILIVDEALSVGDLFFQNKCFRKFDELKQRGVTILFVSHDISSVRQMCSRVLWIERGNQIIFGDSDHVCDLYMDQKRKDLNEHHTISHNISVDKLQTVKSEEYVVFPQIHYSESAIHSEQVNLLAAYITNKQNERVRTIEVDCEYDIHIVIEANTEFQNIIVGCVMENNKGLPLYDFNNFISTRKGISVQPGVVYETVFRFVLPRIMHGQYIMAAAIADGTQKEHVMLTWLHGVDEIEVINTGFNSSYIELPAEVSVIEHQSDHVQLVEER